MSQRNHRLAKFQEKINERLVLFWQKKLQLVADVPIAHEILLRAEMLSRGGKRLRPYMAYIGYLAATNTFSEEKENQICDAPNDILDRLIGLELFHTYALIHDDIVDEATVRHGGKTVHRASQELIGNIERSVAKKEHIGQSYAILAGDMVFGFAYEALFTCLNSENPNSESVALVFPLFSKMVEEVIVGQMIDVECSTKSHVTFTEIENKNTLKTARYSFVFPMKIGAAFAVGRTPASIRESVQLDTFFENVGHELGAAYQIRDDYNDIVGNLGKEIFGDIETGQHTHFTQYIFEKGNENDKALLHRMFGRKLDTCEKEQLRTMFAHSGSLLFGATLARGALQRARTMIELALVKNEITKTVASMLLGIADNLVFGLSSERSVLFDKT